MIDRENIANLVGSFTWNFSNEFFIETQDGNFVWSDPDYMGTGYISEYPGTYEQWIKKQGIPYGRDKGKHMIGSFCGDFKI